MKSSESYQHLKERMDEEQYCIWMEDRCDELYFSFLSLKSFIIQELKSIEDNISDPDECKKLVKRVLSTVQEYK